MKEIKLSQQGRNKNKYTAIVDDDNYDRLNQIMWHVIISKRTNYAKTGIKRNGNNSTPSMHGLIMGDNPLGLDIDHKNRNGLHNYRLNLRFCTKSQNNMNAKKRKNTTSKYKGVCWDKARNKYAARISFNGKKINLGRFDTEIEAALMTMITDVLDEHLYELQKANPALYWDVMHELHIKINGPHFDEKTALYAVSMMQNGDGTVGEHWTYAQTDEVAKSTGLVFDKFNSWDWYFTLNMMYSDYYSLFSLNTDTYISLAKAYLMDVDVSEGKAYKYWSFVVCS